MNEKWIYHLRNVPGKGFRNLCNGLISEGHSRMTGSTAQVDGRAGGKFTTRDRYHFGSTLELIPNQRIVQARRTSEFPYDAPDSIVEILLEELPGGTQVTLS